MYVVLVLLHLCRILEHHSVPKLFLQTADVSNGIVKSRCITEWRLLSK